MQNPSSNSIDRLTLRNFALLATLACVALLVVSCGSTKVLSFSNSKPEAKEEVKSVVTVMVDERSYLRAAVENYMATRFKELGVEAQASHTKIGEKTLIDDTDQARKALEAFGTDAVLVSKLVDRTDISEPPEFVSSQTNWEQVWSAPEASTQFEPNPWGGEVIVTIHLESKLYDAKTSELLWAGYTKTEMKEFSNDLKLIRGISRKVVNRIEKDGWIK